MITGSLLTEQSVGGMPNPQLRTFSQSMHIASDPWPGYKGWCTTNVLDLGGSRGYADVLRSNFPRVRWALTFATKRGFREL